MKKHLITGLLCVSALFSTHAMAQPTLSAGGFDISTIVADISSYFVGLMDVLQNDAGSTPPKIKD